MDLLLFVLVVSVVVLAPMAKASAPEDRIDFDLATEMHDDLYRKLDTYLRQTSNNPPYEPRQVQGRASCPREAAPRHVRRATEVDYAPCPIWRRSRDHISNSPRRSVPYRLQQ